MPETKLTERLKKTVSANAGGVCEYCRSQKDYSPNPFSVEHIKPRVRGGTNTLDNLALSCDGCNGHKHTKMEAPDPINRELVSLFHPRRQRWHEHFEWNSDFSLVIGITPTGRATIEALQINRPGVVNLRRLLLMTDLHPPPEQSND